MPHTLRQTVPYKEDYVIACRTYKRAHLFPDKTYRMLEHNGLLDKLYIFVANADEKKEYEKALDGKKYREIVIGEIGCANVVRFICAHFAKKQKIVFMDDDLARFFCFDANGKLDKDSKALDKYIRDGFETCDKFNLGAFSFSFLSNKFYLQGKPFKEFRPAPLPGSFYGARNIPELIMTKPYTSHAEDIQRAVQFTDHYGGVLTYWWAGFDTQYGFGEGGIQAAGERGAMEERLKRTEEISWRMYKEDKRLPLYVKEPQKVHNGLFYSLKFKPLTTIKKTIASAGKPVRTAKWSRWFSRSLKPDAASEQFYDEPSAATTRKTRKSLLTRAGGSRKVKKANYTFE